MSTTAPAVQPFDLPDEAWSVLEALAGMDERERRALLRFHRDRGVSDMIEVQLRLAIDSAVNYLALREVAFEIGLLPEQQVFEEDETRTTFLRTLLSSNAFVRYADNYLTLNLHFVAERLALDLPATDGDMNEVPVSWPCPPQVGMPADLRASAMDRFRETRPIQPNLLIASAQSFLDDFSLFVVETATTHDRGTQTSAPPMVEQQRSEARAMGGRAQAVNQPLFELWLRGLADPPGLQHTCFELAAGIIAFARQTAGFYDTLETGIAHAPGEPLRACASYVAANPLTARFGLYDLYWIARLLRAEVTPAGTVTYVNSSWLELLAQQVERPNPGSRGTKNPPGSTEKLPPPLTEELRSARAEEMRSCEHVLRSVLDYTCDLVQNALDIVDAELNEAVEATAEHRPAESLGWRAAFDEELEQIARQRHERLVAASPRGADDGMRVRERGADGETSSGDAAGRPS